MEGYFNTKDIQESIDNGTQYIIPDGTVHFESNGFIYGIDIIILSSGDTIVFKAPSVKHAQVMINLFCAEGYDYYDTHYDIFMQEYRALTGQLNYY